MCKSKVFSRNAQRQGLLLECDPAPSALATPAIAIEIDIAP